MSSKAELRNMKMFRLGLCLLMIAFAVPASAQMNARDSMQLPAYQRFPTLPAFNILLQDSSTIFNTYNIPEGRPTVLFFFSPDCDHCIMTTDSLLKNMKSMQGADFHMFTFSSLAMLKPFAEQRRLAEYPNILTVGKDYQYFFPMYYKAETVPYLVVYDRKKRLARLWNGTVKMPELIQLLNSL